jgi:hypothetical protein
LESRVNILKGRASLLDLIYARFSTKTVKVANFTGLIIFAGSARVSLRLFGHIQHKKGQRTAKVDMGGNGKMRLGGLEYPKDLALDRTA